MSIQKFVILFSHLPILVATIYGILKYRHFGSELKAIVSILCFSFFTQFGALGFYLFGINNMPILYVNAVAGFVLFVPFFNAVFEEYIPKLILWFTAAGFVLFSLINLLFFQDVFTFNSNILVVESILVIILCLSTYRFLLNEIIRKGKKGKLVSLNWINSGLFIYFTSNGLLFYFGEVLSSFSPETFRMSWMFHSFFFWVLYVCLIIGIWKHPGN